MTTINFIEYANYLHKLGFCDEIKDMEDLSAVLHSDYLRTRLNTYLSSMQMMDEKNENMIQVIGVSKEEVLDISTEIFDDLIIGEVEKEEDSYIYHHYDAEESFEYYIHKALDYVLESDEDLMFGLSYESLDTGVISFVSMDKENIVIKNYIQPPEYGDFSPFEQYIYILMVASSNLYNTDLFTEMTEVMIDSNYFAILENDLKSQNNHYTIDLARKDYPNLFKDIGEFILALNINPKLFLDAPKEVLEDPVFLDIFLNIIEKNEIAIIQGIDLLGSRNEDGLPDPYTEVIIKDIIHKNQRAIPSIHEMAIAYQDSLKFLRKKSTHKILIGSYIYNRLICLTKNQFEDKSYVTKLQRDLPFFYVNIFFYHAFHKIKNRKYSNIEQIEKDTYQFMNDVYDLNLFDYFEAGTIYDEEFMDSLNFAFRDTIVSMGVFNGENVDFEDDEFNILDDTIKKYYS